MFRCEYTQALPLNCLIGGSPKDYLERRDIFLVPLTPSPAGPLGSIIGYCAPPLWEVAQVKLSMSAATTHICENGDQRHSCEEGVLTLMVSKSGAQSASLEICGHQLDVVSVDQVQEHLDVLRRVLGLPSLLQIPPYEEFVELVWIDRVIARRVASLGQTRITSSGVSPYSVFPQALEELGSWQALQDSLSQPFSSNVAELGFGNHEVPFTTAQFAWMDTPLFAQMLTKGLPTRDEGLAILKELGINLDTWASIAHSA